MKRVKVVLLIGLAVIGAVYAETRPEDMTREQKNKMIVDVAIGAMNEGDWEFLEKMYSPKFLHHRQGRSEHESWEERELAYRIIRQMIPTAKMIIEDIVAEGDKVAVRLKTVVTFKEITGSIVHGKDKVEFAEMDMYRLEGGKIVEEWSEYDTADWEKKFKLLAMVTKWR